jgi:hypothetical protein
MYLSVQCDNQTNVLTFRIISEAQLDNNPYWLRFINVENSKLHLEDYGNIDADNIVEFYTGKLN